MKLINSIALAAAGSLLLTGCLWSPGKFASNLDIRADGTFTLDYKGEVLFQMPDDAKATPWDDGFASCTEEGGANLMSEGGDAGESRDCTAAELAELKKRHEKAEDERLAAKQKEQEETGKVFGMPGLDDASARKFAAKLSKYAGWKSVTYRGKGIYDVDYSMSGTLTQDYVFPIMPDTDLVLPFVAIRKRSDGSIHVTAPALTGGQGPFAARAMMMGLDKGQGSDGGEQMKAEGRFTITTDGEILTNNTENGPTAHARGKALTWDVSPGSTKMPEALIRLK